MLRGVVLAAEKLGWDVVGFRDGFEGLLPPGNHVVLDRKSIDGIMALGGTIIGTTDRGHFVAKTGAGDRTVAPAHVIADAKKILGELEVKALIIIGGDGSLVTALQLQEAGISCIGVPKTIDNDLEATATTFGFDSAVDVVVDALDRLHTTATSHRRVMVVEVMGRHAGWIALHGGIAGGADIILIPEIPFDYDKIAGVIEARERCCVLGHLQRGGAPTTLDRILATRFGVKAVQLANEGHFGSMVSYHNYQVRHVPIAEAVNRLKLVPPNGEIVQTARDVDISFGD